jgi:hypothetical protein
MFDDIRNKPADDRQIQRTQRFKQINDGRCENGKSDRNADSSGDPEKQV